MTVRLGLVGVDSPHAPAFARLAVGGGDSRVGDARVVAAWRGEPSMDFPLSYARIEGFSAELGQLAVPIYDDLEAVAEVSDALLIVAVDARRHPEYFRRLLRFGKPIFVDTRFAPTLSEAQEMLRGARNAGVTVLTGSPKRFATAFRTALASGPVDAIDLNGPMPLQPTHPGVAWYGVHLIDLAVAALGPGCASVRWYGGRNEVFVLTWRDERVAVIRALPQWSPHTRGTVYRESVSEPFDIVADEAMLAGIVESIVSSVRAGRSNVPPAEIEDVVAIVAAANHSRAAGEATVSPPR